MAETLGIVAGAFGIASLSIQLAESVQKVKSFYENVKNAPPRLANLIEEIEGVSECVKELEHEYQSTSLVTSASLQRCIKSSREAVDYFETFAVGLQSRTKKSRFTGGLRFALSQDDIERMLGKLERLKSLLTMAYTQFRQVIQQQQLDDIRQSIEGLSSGQTVILQAVQTADTSGDGEVTTFHRRHFYRQDCVRKKPIFEVKTPSWMSKQIWQLALERSTSGWQFALRTYGIVSSDSQVFKACEAGDLIGMRKLFDAGLASPFDCNDSGDSLWNVSSRLVRLVSKMLNYYQVSLEHKSLDVIRFLLGCGATSVSYAVSGHARPKSFTGQVAHRDRTNNAIQKQASAIFWLFALSERSTSDLHEGTLFLYENCDDADEERPRTFYETDAMRLASCPRERLAPLVFWQRMKYWSFTYRGSTWRYSASTSHSDLLTQYKPADFWGLTQLQLLAVNLGRHVASIIPGELKGKDKILGEITQATIEHGVGIHEGSNGHTPLMMYLSMVLAMIRYWPNDHTMNLGAPNFLREALLIWLNILQTAGVDLSAYGKEEARRFADYRSSSDPVPPLQPWEGLSLQIEKGTVPLFALSYGSTPSEWDVEVVDLMEEYAGGFWRMVDRQTEEDERRRHAIPGGWVDD